MSRSRKQPWVWLSKPWDKFKESSLRRRVKQACHEAEINWDPDKDWEELQQSNKKSDGCGTKCGFECPPEEADSTGTHKEYDRLRRK